MITITTKYAGASSVDTKPEWARLGFFTLCSIMESCPGATSLVSCPTHGWSINIRHSPSAPVPRWTYSPCETGLVFEISVGPRCYRTFDRDLAADVVETKMETDMDACLAADVLTGLSDEACPAIKLFV